MDVQREAIIMERFTDLGNIISTFGHCGASVIVEAVPYEVEEYVVPGTGFADQEREVAFSHNDFAPRVKLRMALEMAESLAVLHGNGVVHNDVQLSQWLRTRNDTLVLGDFNSARILEWNTDESAYCKFSTGSVFGNVSAVVTLILDCTLLTMSTR